MGTFVLCSFAWLACATIPDFLITTSASGIDAGDGGAQSHDGSTASQDGSRDAGLLRDGADPYPYKVFLATPRAGFITEAGAAPPLVAADIACAQDAAFNKIPLAAGHTWRALLFVAGEPDSGLARLPLAGRTWYRSDDAPVLVGDGPLVTELRLPVLAADAAPLDPATSVWLGKSDGLDCNGWGRDGSDSVSGAATTVGEKHLVDASSAMSCYNAGGIYCFEVP